MPAGANVPRNRRARARTRRVLLEHLEPRTLLAILPPSGLVSWYRAEGDAKDWVSGNNGTLMNGATFAGGEVNNGFELDGLNDAVEVPDATSLDPSNVTVDAWVKFDNLDTAGASAPGLQYIVFKHNSRVDPAPYFEGYALLKVRNGDADYLSFQMAGANASLVYLTGTTPIQTAQFYHVAGTYDGVVAKLYVNGVLEAFQDTSIVLNYSATPLFFGTSGDSVYDGKLQGVIDEVQIYNRALAASEVQSIHAAGQEGLATIVVNTSGDTVDANDGVTSLREAINQSNASVGVRDVIGFDIPSQPAGLVSRWSAEKAANDSIDGNEGTLKNGATFSPGVIGQAFDFSAHGSYVQVPDNADLRLGTGDLTLDAWIQTGVTGVNRTIIAKAGTSNSYPDYEIRIGASNHAEFLASDSSTAGGFTPVASTSIVTDGLFHHVAGVRRGGTLEIYVDGVLENTLSFGPKNTDSDGPLTIGGPSDGNDFQGLVDESEIYRRALSPSEINDIYQTDKALTPPAVVPAAVSFYHADGNASDAVGSNNGTLVGDATYSPGILGQAFSFDGNGDSVAVPDAPTLDPTTAITLAAWVYPTSDSGSPDVMGIIINKEQRDSSGQGIYQYEIGRRNNVPSHTGPGIPAGNLAFYFDGLYASLPHDADSWVDGDAYLPLNTWSHVAVTFDGSHVRAYVNGHMTRELAVSGTLSVSNGDLHIGARDVDIPRGYWAGKIDEAGIYNKALTPAEVASLAAPPAPISLYRGEGNVNDSVGGNNGTLQGGATFAPGIVGQALNLNGTSAFVQAPSSPNLNPGSGSFTVEAAVYQTGFGQFADQFNIVLGKTDGDFGNGYALTGALPLLGGKAAFDIQGTHGFAQVQTAGPIPLNQWVHLAAVYDTAAHTLSIYVNGQLSNSVTGVNVGGVNPSANLLIGKYQRTSLNRDEFFSGLIDEATVYNVALTAAEIQAHVAAGLLPQSLVRTISPTLQLPVITDPVIIDGYTQPGASPNTLAVGDNAKLLIELNGQNAGGATGLPIVAGNSTIRGLDINRFTYHGIYIGSADNVVEGNFIGVDASGTIMVGNGWRGVEVSSSAAQRNSIGGATPAARNVISGNGFTSGFNLHGVDIFDGASFTTVYGNYIGTNAAGTGALPNAGQGIVINSSSYNFIGGNVPGEGNLISGNQFSGVLLLDTFGRGTSNIGIYGNLIGTDAAGTGPLPNGAYGIRSENGQNINNIGIGTAGAGAGNVIAFNKQAGISIVVGSDINISGNSVFNNGGLGIDLGADGATANDAGDADSGPNNLQNFPVISYATRSNGQLKVTYSVPTDPTNAGYPLRVEFFLADSTGQGKTYLGFDTFSAADYQQTAKTVTVPIPVPLKFNDRIVATASEIFFGLILEGTSEFSASAPIVSTLQNPRNPLDVDDDTLVTPKDIVRLISYLNGYGASEVPDDAANAPDYLDCDGDNIVAPKDLLLIITHLNAFGAGEGEAAVVSSQFALTVSQASNDVLTLLAADAALQSTRPRK